MDFPHKYGLKRIHVESGIEGNNLYTGASSDNTRKVALEFVKATEDTTILEKSKYKNRQSVFSSSIQRASDITSNANFVAEYAPINGSDINSDIELTFTILFSLFFSINGRTFFVNPIRPKKFVSNWLLRSSKVISSIAPGSTYSALFTIPKIVLSLAFKIILLTISLKSSV